MIQEHQLEEVDGKRYFIYHHFCSTYHFVFICPIGTSTSNIWNYDSGGTPSSSTGSTTDAAGSSSGTICILKVHLQTTVIILDIIGLE